MQMEETNRVDSGDNFEGPAQAGQPAANNSESSTFSYNFRERGDAATTSLGTVRSRAWLLEWIANCFRWFANLLWWFANHMWQVVKPAASCELRLENSTIAQEPRLPAQEPRLPEQEPQLPAQPHGRVDFDVFLNHRGPDVKRAFVAHLYRALIDEGLNPFLDKHSLAQGRPAFASIDAALEMAKVHVAVVSVGYAESKYCLTELVAMLRSGKPVIPVFYDVEPAHLRRVETGAFAEAFEKHRSRETADRVREWADALRKLADITAFVFHLSDYRGDEAELKSEVVGAILRFLPQIRPLQVEKYLVGLEGPLETCVSAVKAMCDTRSVLGLFGMGGVGKTCLAKVVYNHLITHGEFKGACFLEIGQTLRSSKKHAKLGWLQSLQGQLLWDLLRLGEERQARQHYEHWFDKLSSLGPVLIGLDGLDGLDDIQNKDYFDKLIPIADALAPGSCIIVTSRDRHLLNLISCDCHFLKRIEGTAKFYLHEVIPLDIEDSLKLFNWHAFGNEEAPESFRASSSGVSKAYGGLPLALKVVGSGLHGKFSSAQQEYIWLEAMEALGHHDIRRALQWSYDCLSEEEKMMFVDIAFLFCGWKKVDILKILGSCKECSSCCGNMAPYTSLDHLIDKSLVTLDKEVINMHALVQELGLRIGKEEGSHLKMVKKFRVQNGGKVRALKLGSIGNDFELDIERFKEMPNLHFLILNECVLHGNNKDIFEEVRYLQLKNCTIKPLLFMPSLSNLVSLDMTGSSKFTIVGRSELALEACPNLVTLNLSKCDSITRLPDSIGQLTRLQVLNMTDCLKLQELPNSLEHLTSLQELLLGGCESLKALPKFITRLRDHSYVCAEKRSRFVSCEINYHPVNEYNDQYEYHLSKFSSRGFSVAIELSTALGLEAVVFSGRVNKNLERECSVVVSTKLPVTKEKLRDMSVTHYVRVPKHSSLCMKSMKSGRLLCELRYRRAEKEMAGRGVILCQFDDHMYLKAGENLYFDP